MCWLRTRGPQEAVASQILENNATGRSLAGANDEGVVHMRSLRSGFGLLAAAVLSFAFTDAQAVPSFARQSGMDCTTCHMSWLELTNVGRRFKLGGYQLTKAMAEGAERPLISFRFDDNPPLIPIAGMLQFSVNNTQNRNTPNVNLDDRAGQIPYNDQVVLGQASLFLNGKIAPHVGCFCQLTWDGVASRALDDNFDIRFANDYNGGKFNALYGLSLNNSPTMSDVLNTTTVWGWPYVGAAGALAPAAATLINGGLAQSVAGLSAYALINRTVYLEFGGYRTADSVFSFLRAGVDKADLSRLDGIAPYYRAFLQHEWDHGHQSAQIGTFGLTSNKYPDWDTKTGPTDKFADTGFDAQYQYITDKNRFSWMYSYIHEKQTLNASGSQLANPVLNEINTKVSYYRNKWYGASFGYHRTTGSTDNVLYPYSENDPEAAVNGFAATNTPDSEAFIGELNWVISPTGKQAFRRSRLVFQYTAYQKFNGASTNYDGSGRNASDNNTASLILWLMY
jgi:hypothetical protein